MSNRTPAEWRALLAKLRKPGDSVFVRISRAQAFRVLQRCGPARPYIRARPTKLGIRFVRIDEPKRFTRRIANLKPGEALVEPAHCEPTLATLATRARRAYPQRRYRTHKDITTATFRVIREA